MSWLKAFGIALMISTLFALGAVGLLWLSHVSDIGFGIALFCIVVVLIAAGIKNI